MEGSAVIPNAWIIKAYSNTKLIRYYHKEKIY